jgi:RHS repeat-associated protein
VEDWIGGTTNGRKYQYVFDAANNMVASFEGTSLTTGHWRTHQFDLLRRQTAEAAPLTTGGGTVTATMAYAYDAASRQTRAEDKWGNFVNTFYDAAGRVSTKQFGTAAATVTYQSDYFYAPDVVGKLDRLASQVNGQVVTAGGPAGGPNVLTMAMGHDGLGRVTAREFKKAGNVVVAGASNTYDDNKAGLVKTTARYGAENVYQNKTTYDYDAHGQIASYTYESFPMNEPMTSPWSSNTVTMTYDANGNSPYATLSAATSTERPYALGATDAATYDAEGNVVKIDPRRITTYNPSKGTYDTFLWWVRKELDYDHRNRLTQVRTYEVRTDTPGQPGAHVSTLRDTVTYEYDAEDKLVARTDARSGYVPNLTDEYGTTDNRTNFIEKEQYVHDGANVWADANGSGEWQRRYVHALGADSLLARQDAAAAGVANPTYWYATDNQGSVTAVVSAADLSVVKALEYQGGSKVSARQSNVYTPARFHDRFEYTGRDADFVTGLQNNRARWLSVAGGRFLSEDSWGFAAGDTNLSRYAGNTWPNATDPSGHIWSWAAMGIGALVGAAVGVAGTVIGAAITGDLDKLTWGKVAGAAVNGAIAGAIVGAVAGALTGDVSGLVLGAAIGAVAGAAGGAAGSITEQLIDKGKVDWDQVGTATAMGFVSGAVGGAIGGAVGRAFAPAIARGASQEAVKQATGMACNMTVRQVAAFTARNAASGAVSGMLTDASMQILVPDEKGFSFRRLIAAGVNGGLGGGAGYLANRAAFKSCFPAGTPLLTPDGAKAIEDFKVGDLVLSRDEWDPAGPVEPKAVEEVFVRHARVMYLTVAGRRIGTTSEHPFYVPGKGWLSAGDLAVGDMLVGHDGQTVRVDAKDAGEWATVYNLRIADWHTYFVGAIEWGFDAWSHNSNGCETFVAAMEKKGVHPKTARKMWNDHGGENMSPQQARQLVEKLATAGHIPPAGVDARRPAVGSRSTIRALKAAGINDIEAKPRVSSGNDTALGNKGERVAMKWLGEQGYEVLGSLKNNSGHGLDIVAKKDGVLYIIDAKTSRTNNGGLSQDQRKLGPVGYAEKQVGLAQDAKGRWREGSTPNGTRDFADTLAPLIEQHKAAGTIQGFRVKIEHSGRGDIRQLPWDQP